MTETEYWIEAIECSLDEQGIPDSLTKDQRTQLAKDMHVANENRSMAFYSPSPSDIFADRERELLKKVKRAEDEAARTVVDFKKNIAMRHGCEVQDVTLEEGGNARVSWSKLA